MGFRIDDTIEMEFFKLNEAIPEDTEIVTLVLEPNTISPYHHIIATNTAGNQIVCANTRVFKRVPPKFTVRTHYGTYDITHDQVLYWGRIKKD